MQFAFISIYQKCTGNNNDRNRLIREYNCRQWLLKIKYLLSCCKCAYNCADCKQRLLNCNIFTYLEWFSLSDGRRIVNCVVKVVQKRQRRLFRSMRWLIYSRFLLLLIIKKKHDFFLVNVNDKKSRVNKTQYSHGDYIIINKN